MSENAQRLLEALFAKAEGYIEFRFIRGKEVHRRFWGLAEVDYDLIGKLNSAGFDVYFSICPRRERKGMKAAVGCVVAIWADLDGGDFARGKEEAFSQLKSLADALQPSAIVDSGHGYHLYWLLDHPVPVSGEEDIGRLEGYVAGLAKLLGGDTVQDLSRLMRLPETHNWKDPEHPVKCNVVSFNPGRRFDLSAFEQYWVATGHGLGESIAFSSELPKVDIEDVDISARMKDLAIHGFSPDCGYRSRSEADQAVITDLVRVEATPDKIKALFLRYPIGERYRERGDEYLQRSIAKAMQFLESQRKEDVAMDITPKRKAEDEDRLSYSLAEQPPEQEEIGQALVEDFAWPGQVIEIVAPGGEGKTSFCCNAAAAFALGERVWGRFQVTRPCRVLYLNLEMRPGEIRAYIETIIGGREGLGLVNVAELAGVGFDLFNQEWEQRLRKEIARVRPDVVIGDNFGTMSVADENSAQDVRRFMAIIHSICREFNCMFILVHHTGWQMYGRDGEPLPRRGSRDQKEDRQMARIIARAQGLVPSKKNR